MIVWTLRRPSQSSVDSSRVLLEFMRNGSACPPEVSLRDGYTMDIPSQPLCSVRQGRERRELSSNEQGFVLAKENVPFPNRTQTNLSEMPS